MFEAPPHVPVVDDDSTPSVSSQQWQMARNLVGIDRKGKSNPQTRQDTTRQVSARPNFKKSWAPKTDGNDQVGGWFQTCSFKFLRIPWDLCPDSPPVSNITEALDSQKCAFLVALACSKPGPLGRGGASNIAPPKKTTKTSNTDQYQAICVGERPLPPLVPGMIACPRGNCKEPPTS